MTGEEDRDKQLAAWLVQKASAIEADRQRQRMEAEEAERSEAIGENLRRQAIEREFQRRKNEEQQIERTARELDQKLERVAVDMQRKQNAYLTASLWHRPFSILNARTFMESGRSS